MCYEENVSRRSTLLKMAHTGHKLCDIKVNGKMGHCGSNHCQSLAARFQLSRPTAAPRSHRNLCMCAHGVYTPKSSVAHFSLLTILVYITIGMYTHTYIEVYTHMTVCRPNGTTSLLTIVTIVSVIVSTMPGWRVGTANTRGVNEECEGTRPCSCTRRTSSLCERWSPSMT